MSWDIWYPIALQLDYKDIFNICRLTIELSLISTSRRFWTEKAKIDFGVEVTNFNTMIHQLNNGRETYLYWAGITTVPLPGAEKYGSSYDLIKRAAQVADDKTITYFYNLTPYSFIFKYFRPT